MNKMGLLSCCSHCMIFVFFVAMVSTQSCPQYCRCKLSYLGRTVDCSNAGLTLIPTELVPMDTAFFLLNQNNIQSIDELRWLPDLRTLDLGGNPIVRIPGNMFRNVSNLLKLRLTADVIDENAFSGLLQLETLIITGYSRNIKVIPDTLLFPLSRSLVNLAIRNTGNKHLVNHFRVKFNKLDTVDLSGNLLSKFPQTLLANSLKLRRLRLNENSITEIIFNSTTRHLNLEELEIAHNQLSSLPLNLSSILPSLEVFDLSFNRFHLMPNLANMTRLSHLFMQYNLLAILNEGQLPPHVAVLNIGHNPWIRIQKKAFSNLTSVRILKLQNISSVVIDLSGLQHQMEEIDLSRNCQLENYTLPKEFQILTLNFSHSCLTDFPFLLDRRSVGLVIDIHGNKLRNLTVNRVVENTLNASHNNINFLNITSDRSVMKYLDVGHNNITSLDDVHIVPNVFVQFLNITFNHIKNLTNFYTVRKEHIDSNDPIKLDISYNQISHISSDAFPEAFPLAVLKMSYNKLSSLPDKLFSNQFALKKLDLNHNYLVGLSQYQLKNLSRLEHLLVCKNRIQNISLSDFGVLPNLKSLSLSDNPFNELPFDFLLGDNSKFKRLELKNSLLLCECSLTRTLMNVKRIRQNTVIKGDCVERPSKKPRDLNFILSTYKMNKWICENNCSAQTNLQNDCQDTAIEFNATCQKPRLIFNNGTLMNGGNNSLCYRLFRYVEISQSNCSWSCDEGSRKQRGYLNCFGLSNSFCGRREKPSQTLDHNHLTSVEIVLIVVGGVFGILVAVIFCLYFYRRVRRTKGDTDMHVLTEFEAHDDKIVT